MKTKPFAESYLANLLERRMLSIDGNTHLYEASRGLSVALKEIDQAKAAPLEKLADAVSRVGLGEAVAVVNLLNMPLGSLWVRAALQQAAEKLSGLARAQIVIVGLWRILKGGSGRRTGKTEERFAQWKEFVEAQLLNINAGELNIIWVG
jgi:hypothetical protein